MGFVASYNSFAVSILKRESLFFCKPLRKFRDERLCEIATKLSQKLLNKTRVSIKDAQSDSLVLETRQFFKNLKVIDPRSSTGTASRVDQCAKQLLAFQLGIDAGVFDVNGNAGFVEFARKSALVRYLLEYNDRLVIDPLTQQISLKANHSDFPAYSADAESILLSWDKIHAEMQKWPKPQAKPNLPWYYGMNGIQNKDMFNWSTLTPYKKDDPSKWDNRFVLNICVCSDASPRLQGDHSWIELNTPSGHIYSAGLYLEAKTVDWKKLPNSFSVKDAYIQSPDVSRFWPCKIDAIAMEITEDDCTRIKAEIEKNKAEERNYRVFQLMQANCLMWSKNIAKKSSNFEDLPTVVRGTRVLTPRRIERLMDIVSPHLPKCVHRICELVGGFFVNLLLFIFGAGKLSCAAIKKQNAEVKPHLESVLDLFKVSKSELHHPFYFANTVIPWVNKWRNEQVKLVEKRTDLDEKEKAAEIVNIKYRLPPKEYPL